MHGHLFPLVPILEELRRRDHEVTVRTLAAGVKTLRSLGFEAEPVDPRIEALAHDDWRARNPAGGVMRNARLFRERAGLDGPDLGAAIAAQEPDAVIVDVLSWGALSAAEAAGVPWATYSPLPLLIPSRDVPPQGPGLRPASGAPGRIRDRLLQSLFQSGFDRLVLARLNAIRSSLGLRELDHAHDLFRRPPLFLQMSSAAFEYGRSDVPPNVVMVGPCAWDPPLEIPDELAAIERPLVLVTTSTDFQNDGRLVRVALDAFAGEPLHVVATVPAASANELPVQVNASVLPFVPHSALLERTACTITHGGMGTTQKSLAGGVPACAVPFGRDQFEVARRVEVSGAGARLPSWRLNPDRLRGKVREAIACRAGAERVAQSFADTGGVKTAADAFEQRLLG